MVKIAPLIALVYSGVAIFIYMRFFYYEEIGALYSFTFPFIIFIPLLLVGLKGVSKLGINLSAILGFAIGFGIYGAMSNVNIWPISMILGLFLALPSIFGLNLIGMYLKTLKKA
jgi:hypothetical protein